MQTYIEQLGSNTIMPGTLPDPNSEWQVTEAIYNPNWRYVCLSEQGIATPVSWSHDLFFFFKSALLEMNVHDKMIQLLLQFQPYLPE